MELLLNTWHFGNSHCIPSVYGVPAEHHLEAPVVFLALPLDNEQVFSVFSNLRLWRERKLAWGENPEAGAGGVV